MSKPETKAMPKPEATAEAKPEATAEGRAPKQTLSLSLRRKPSPSPKPKPRPNLTPKPEHSPVQPRVSSSEVHQLYEELGREDVRAVQDWEKAERKIREDKRPKMNRREPIMNFARRYAHGRLIHA